MTDFAINSSAVNCLMLCRDVKKLEICANNLQALFRDLLLRFYLYGCVWSDITAHNLSLTLSNPHCVPALNIQVITGIALLWVSVRTWKVL